jgi:uncharacterized protein YlaN (UPF0358 family)
MEMTSAMLESRREAIDMRVNDLLQLRQRTAEALQNIEVQLVKLQGQRELVEEMLKTDGQGPSST